MNGIIYDVLHCGAISTPHSHPSWAQIFALDSPGNRKRDFMLVRHAYSQTHEALIKNKYYNTIYLLNYSFTNSYEARDMNIDFCVVALANGVKLIKMNGLWKGISDSNTILLLRKMYYITEFEYFTPPTHTHTHTHKVHPTLEDL